MEDILKFLEDHVADNPLFFIKCVIAGIFITVLFSLLKDFFAMAFYTTRTDFWNWYYGFRGKFMNTRRRHTLKNNDTSKINDDYWASTNFKSSNNEAYRPSAATEHKHKRKNDLKKADRKKSKDNDVNAATNANDDVQKKKGRKIIEGPNFIMYLKED